LRGRLDPGGDGLDPQAVREADRRPHDRPAAALPADVADHGGVDPDAADRQAGEPGQRQETAGRRVERDRNPVVIQGTEGILHGVGRVPEQHILGHGDLQMRRIEAEAPQQRFGFAKEAGVPDRPAGGAQSDAAGRVARGAEYCQTRERALHQRAAEFARQAAFFRDRKELAGRYEPAAVVPVRHGVEGHVAAAQRAPRRPGDRDPLAGDGAPQGLGHARAVAEGRCLLRPESAPSAPAAPLRLVERQIGVLEQAMHVPTVGREDGHAARQADLQTLAQQLQCAGERLVDVAHAGGGRLGRVGAGGQENEFIAAEARDDILRPRQGAQAPRQLDQQGVAHVMAVRVVDLLEVVDVEEDERAAGPSRAVVIRERALEGDEQRRAVGEAGERVVLRLMPQAGLGLGGLMPRPLLRLASRRDVRLDGDEAGERARLVPERAAADRDPIGPAIAAVVQHFGFETFSARDAGAHMGAGRGVGAVTLQQRAGVMPLDLGRRNAGEAGEGLVAPFRPAGDIRDDHSARHVPDDEGQAVGILAILVPRRDSRCREGPLGEARDYSVHC
jgi:hypothetical protein